MPPLWHLPKQPLVQQLLAAKSFDPIAASLGAAPGASPEAPRRVGFSLGCQKELRSSPGGPEESELCRINEPLVLSLGLMNPQSKGCPPQDLHCLPDSPKSVFTFCNYLIIQSCLVTAGSPRKGPWTCAASGPTVLFGWQIAEQGLGATAVGFQQREGSRLRARRPRPVESWGASCAFLTCIPLEKRLQGCSKEFLNS